MPITIKKLAQENVYLGGSSWKYPGWRGLLYKKEYASERAFKEECLKEYSEHYLCVGVDHTYYDWPNPSLFQKYKNQTPDNFRFGLKVTEAITVFKYPQHPRYGKRRGQANPSFLDPTLFLESFLSPLVNVQDRLGPIMLEFSQFYPGTLKSGGEFVEKLDGFLERVKPQERGVLMAVEIRNQNWLREPYFATLQKHGVAHVCNSWTRMPSLATQLSAQAPFELPAIVARLLLQPGTKYAEAVETFSPYDKIIEESDSIRDEAADLIRAARLRGIPAYVFVNNRCEGCSPRTIEAILQRLL